MERTFHACVSPHGLRLQPELPQVLRQAGVTNVWIASFLYGTWYQRPAQLGTFAARFEEEGIRVRVVNVPLGHPGNALGISDEHVPLTPPPHWRMAQRPDGSAYSGTSIHPPAQEENVLAVREIARAGFCEVFLDDDFRVAPGPGNIGGCFCSTCREEFLALHGYAASAWDELLSSVATRSPSEVLRAWVEFWCRRLHGMLRAQQMTAPVVTVGIMVMYLGAEKAGIPLDRLGHVPFRVGEMMFNDADFRPVKGKTNELFSSLFHRRFTSPELAFSETTAFPADQLSAPNMAAKLAVSLISDVRNTMFMSGLWPIPITHWDTLGPAMRKSARLHGRVAGHRPRGPFKHFHGWDSRIVGDDNPFSLFLASGVPFEVVNELPSDGWAFLGDADARAVAEGRLKGRGRHLVVRDSCPARAPGFVRVPETLPAMTELKRKVAPDLVGVPHIEGDVPAVFAWYPSASCALLWNLSDEAKAFPVVRDGRQIVSVPVGPLDVELVGLPTDA